MVKKFLHVGIGRSSNITLINTIYPIISKYSEYKFYTSDDKIHDEVNINHAKMKLGFDVSPISKSEENLIIADERLVGWNPYNWKSYADANLKMFGNDTTVLITLREPLDYLNSMYKNQCLVHGNLMTADEYFALHENYNIEDKKIFYIENFSYKKLKELYEARFEEVIFLDYKNIKDMNFFQKYFNLSNDAKDQLKKAYQDTPPNKSFNSNFANKLTLILYNVLKFIALIFNSNLVRKAFVNLKVLSNKKIITDKIMSELILKQIKKMNKSDIKFNFYSSVLVFLKWSKFMFFIESFLKKPKKFQINLNEKKIHIIKKCEKEYLK